MMKRLLTAALILMAPLVSAATNRTVMTNSTQTLTGLNTFVSTVTVSTISATGDILFPDSRGYSRSLGKMSTTIAEMETNTLLDKSSSTLTCSGTTLTYNLWAMDKKGKFNFNGITYPQEAVSASINLVAGTDLNPKTNHVYFYLSGGVPTMAVSEVEPDDVVTPNVGVATFIIGTVSGGTYTSYTYSRDRDETESFVNRTIHRLEAQGGIYESGYVPVVTQSSVTIGTGEFFNGIFEMYSSNVLGSDSFYFVDSAGRFIQGSSLAALGFYSDGTALGNNERANIVWGFVPTSTTGGGLLPTTVKLVAVLQSKPSSIYNSDASARQDLYEATNYYPPNTEVRKVFIPVARTIISQSDYTKFKTFDTGLYYKDLRGKIMSGGSAAASVDLSGYAALAGATFTGAVALTGANSYLSAQSSVTAPTFYGNLSGNATTVTTNANLTGNVTSVGNATTIVSAPASAIDLSTVTSALAGKLTSPATFYIVPTSAYLVNPASFSILTGTYLTSPATSYWVNSSDYLVNPATFTINSGTYLTAPATFTILTGTYLTSPATFSYMISPATYTIRSGSYLTEPATFTILTGTYLTAPATFSYMISPATYTIRSGSYLTAPATFTILTGSYLTSPATFSYLISPATYTIRSGSYLTEPATFTILTGTYLTAPATFTILTGSYLTSPATFSYMISPATYTIRSGSYLTEPATFTILTGTYLTSPATTYWVQTTDYLVAPASFTYQATGSYITSLTGSVTASGPGAAEATIVSVPASAVDLSTVTSALAGKLANNATVSTDLIDLSTVTSALAGKLSNAATVSTALIDLSTVTSALSGKLSNTATVSAALIDLSTVTSALAGKLSDAATVSTALIDLSTVTSAMAGYLPLAGGVMSGYLTNQSSITATNEISASKYQINGTTVLVVGAGVGSIFLGQNAGRLTTGTYDTYLGFEAGYTTVGAARNTYVGYQAGRTGTGSYNTMIGAFTGYSLSTGYQNTYVGNETGYYITTGKYNTAVGQFAMKGNTTGSCNVVLGQNAMGQPTTTGGKSSNTIVGFQAGYGLLANADKNIFIGSQAGYAVTTGSGNILIGYDIQGVTNSTNTLNIGNLITGQLDASSVTIQGSLYVTSSMTIVGGNSEGSIYPSASSDLGGGLSISTNVYIVGFSSAAKYYGDGSGLTGVTAGPALVNVQVFTATGTQTYTPTAGATKAIVELWAGGGGSDDSGTYSLGACSNAGGAGGYALYYLPTISGTYQVVVGTGGLANDPNAGGISTFTDGATVVTAYGGEHGHEFTNGDIGIGAAGGGVSTNGTINMAGQASGFSGMSEGSDSEWCEPGGVVHAMSPGGSTSIGAGARSTSSTATAALPNSGAGASGTYSGYTGRNRAGAAGGSGLIKITEFR